MVRSKIRFFILEVFVYIHLRWLEVNLLKLFEKTGRIEQTASRNLEKTNANKFSNHGFYKCI